MSQVTSLSLPLTGLAGRAVKGPVPRFTCSAEISRHCSCVGSGCYILLTPWREPLPLLLPFWGSSPLPGICLWAAALTVGLRQQGHQELWCSVTCRERGIGLRGSEGGHQPEPCSPGCALFRGPAAHFWFSTRPVAIHFPNSFFFPHRFIYLFIFGCIWVFVAARGLSLVAASRVYSLLWCTGFSLRWPLLLRSTGSRHMCSVVVAHGLSCSTACVIFPDQGLNPCLLHWQADS